MINDDKSCLMMAWCFKDSSDYIVYDHLAKKTPEFKKKKIGMQYYEVYFSNRHA